MYNIEDTRGQHPRNRCCPGPFSSTRFPPTLAPPPAIAFDRLAKRAALGQVARPGHLGLIKGSRLPSLDGPSGWASCRACRRWASCLACRIAILGWAFCRACPCRSRGHLFLVIPRSLYPLSFPVSYIAIPGLPLAFLVSEIQQKSPTGPPVKKGLSLCSHAAAQPYSRSGHRQRRQVGVSVPVAPSVSVPVAPSVSTSNPQPSGVRILSRPCRQSRQSRPFRGPGLSTQQPSGGLIRVLSARWPTSSSLTVKT